MSRTLSPKEHQIYTTFSSKLTLSPVNATSFSLIKDAKHFSSSSPLVYKIENTDAFLIFGQFESGYDMNKLKEEFMRMQTENAHPEQNEGVSCLDETCNDKACQDEKCAKNERCEIECAKNECEHKKHDNEKDKCTMKISDMDEQYKKKSSDGQHVSCADNNNILVETKVDESRLHAEDVSTLIEQT
ncbi:hypothetical protein COBT_003461, partial [Conglomerata obtusa]